MHADDDVPDQHFNLQQASRYIGRSATWLRAQLQGPHGPPGFKLGKSWLLKKSAVDAWLEHLRTDAESDQERREDRSAC
jgi:hypothetical protein